MPNTNTGEIQVFALNKANKLDHLDSIKLPYPVDNFSVDRNGDLFIAGFPQGYKWGLSARAPFDVLAPTAVFRIKKAIKRVPEGQERKGIDFHGKLGDWTVEKVIEDDGSVVGGATIAVHDVEAGRYFMGGAVAPFITICEEK